MGAVATKTFADFRRRRLQSFALATVMLLSSATATLALNILVASHDPFDRAFDAANGAHLVIAYAPSVTDAQLEATTSAPGVTAAAGPYPMTQAAFAHPKGGLVLDQAISGRAQPTFTIDNVAMVGGRWWSRPGEIVLSQETARLLTKRVGDSFDVYRMPKGADGGGGKGLGGPVAVSPSGADQPPVPVLTMTVVGIAASVSTSGVSAWMDPSDLATVAEGRPIPREMLYRVSPSATDADLATATASITSGLPADAVAGRISYLDGRASVNSTADLYVPVLLAFSAFALLAAAFAIANLVIGIVLTTYRDIGVMKAVGFTPAQVTSMLVAQIVAPAAVGTLAGVAIGALTSQPTVARTTEAFGLPPSFTISPLVLLVVPAISLAVTAVAALAPAIRAGRLSAVAAIGRGTLPSTGALSGGLRRFGLRLPVALPLRLGATAGLAHPGRAAMTLGALVVGVAAMTFALGTNLSLLRIMTQLNRNETAPVRAELIARPGGGIVDPATITGEISADPNTGRWVALGQSDVTVPVAGKMPFVGYDGDASWIGYALIQGRWLSGPGEVVAPTNVFRQTGLHLGDSISVAGTDGTVTLRLVGEIFDSADESPDNLVLRGTWSDLAMLDASASPDHWEIVPREGVSADTLRSSLGEATHQAVPIYVEGDSSNDAEFLLFLSVVGLLGAVLVAISIGGVFNTVLLETRQRTRELAILKAIGLTPRQVVTMVVSSVLGVGLVAGMVGVPLGLAIRHAVLEYMGNVAAKVTVPESSFDVLGPAVVAGLVLSGLAIAVAGAILPALRAARLLVAPVLQAE